MSRSNRWASQSYSEHPSCENTAPTPRAVQGRTVRVRGGISFLKTVNTLQLALQKHKGGDGPSKHEVHLQRCQESPREHMPHNRGISGHRRYPPKAHLDSLGCKSLSDPNRSIAAG